MATKPLYFVTLSTLEAGVLFGGHWYADDAEAAREIARAQYDHDRTHPLEGGPDLSHYPPADACEAKARKSTSYANALNKNPVPA